MGSGSSKSTPTILKGFRAEWEPKTIPFQENTSRAEPKPKNEQVPVKLSDDSGGDESLKMEETSDDDDTILVSKTDHTQAEEVVVQEEEKDFVITVDGQAKSGWPIRCLAKLDFNINAHHGGCAGLMLISCSYGGKGEETNCEVLLIGSGFDCNHMMHKSIMKIHEGHFGAENSLIEDEKGTLVVDCLFGNNNIRLLTNDSQYGNLRNGVFAEGIDGAPTVLPLNVNGSWKDGPGAGLTLLLCSSHCHSAAYLIKSGFKDNKFLHKLLVGEDKFSFDLQDANLTVSGPNGSRYGLFHNRNNLTEGQHSNTYVSQVQNIDGTSTMVLLEKVQGHASVVVLCSNSKGYEDSTAAAMYYIALCDGVVKESKQVAGVHGKHYDQSDLWTFEVREGHLEVTGPKGPCKYGLMSNILATKEELLSSRQQTTCIATGEQTKTRGKVKITKDGISGEVNKPSDIHIMWNHEVIVEMAGNSLKKEDGIYKFSHNWSDKEKVVGLHMVRVFAVRKHLTTGEDVFLELTGSPHQLTFQKAGVAYALNCAGPAYQASNDIVYSSEFSQYANYDYNFNRGYSFKSLGVVKTNASLPGSMLKSFDGFLYTRSRNAHGQGDEGQCVHYKVENIPNGNYVFRLHSNNYSENMVCNGQEVSQQIREQIARQKDPLDIDHFSCYTVDINTKVTNGIFEIMTKAMDMTFRHSEKVCAFAVLDKKLYKEKSISVTQMKEEVLEKQRLADSVIPLGSSFTRKELTIVGWSQNLLQNASAEFGNMKYWNTTGDFKIGTGGYNTERCVHTSYSWCEKYQEVCLTEQFTEEYLDTAPDIQVMEWYTQGSIGGGFYCMTVKLLDIDGNVIKEYTTGEIGSVYNPQWLEASHVFSNYGPGVRIVAFSSRGKDDKFWQGHFGVQISGAEVRVKRETKPASDDKYCDLDLTGSESEGKMLTDKLVTQVLGDNKELLKDFIQDEAIPVDNEFERQTELGPTDTALLANRKKKVQRKKREIRVFVSSTFKDFSSEREEIIKKAFREINRMCSDRGVFFTYVDLRWGITSEQTSDGKTISICLQEIDKCRPYFICLMGERFGWCQQKEKKDTVLDMTYDYAINSNPNFSWIEKYRYDTSVTQLEILHGALNDTSGPKDKCFFYLRDPVEQGTMPEAEYKKMKPESDWHKERLQVLRSKVLENKDFKVAMFKNAGEVSELIKQDLEKAIDKDFPIGTELTKLEQQREAHTAFAEARCRVYIGRDEYFQTVNEYRNKDSNQPFVLLGESGSGKSAFVANWAKRVEASEPDTFMFVHFIGSSADSANYLKLIRRLYEEIKEYYELDIQIPTSDNHLINELGKWLRVAGSRSKVVIVFDALNQLDDGSGQDGPEDDLLWIPSETPPNVFILLSTLPGRAMDACKDLKWPSMKIEPLDNPQKEQIITDYLTGVYGKTLNQEQKEMIVNAKQTSNALYLKSLLDEVRMYGSFRTLTDKIRDYLTADSPGDLFAKILERLELDFEQGSFCRPSLVRDATTALWCSNRGMSEAELTELLKVNSAVWSPFYLSLFENLVNRDGILNFFHDHLRQAVEKKYLSTGEEKRKCYLNLADFFENKDLSNRKVEELPFLLMKAGELGRLKATVGDLDVFFKMTNSEDGTFELVKAWRTLGDFNLAAEAYSQKLKEIPKEEKHGRFEHFCQLYTKLGIFYKSLGLMEAAKDIYLILIEQLESNFGVSHGTVVYSAHNHSWLYRCKHPSVIKSLQELGSVYSKLGEYDKAIDIYNDAINRQNRIDTPSQKLQLCEGLIGLASVYAEKDKMADAKYLMTRALELALELFGRKHHFVAAIFTKLGQLSYKQGRIDEALAYYLQDLKVTRSEVGTHHPRTATVLNEIGLVYDDKNDLMAGKLYEAALSVILETYGNNYLGTAVVRYNLGAFYFGTNYFSKAKYQFEEAFKVFQSYLGDDHPDTIAAKQACDNVTAL